MTPWGHFQVLVACGLDALWEKTLSVNLFRASILDFPEVPELCPANVSRLCVQGKGFLLASPGMSLCILLC